MFTSVIAAAGLLRLASAYTLVDDFSGKDFFTNFDFYTGADPTNGYVNYVNQTYAENAGLINTKHGQAYIGVDSTNVASSSGRSSVRISSTNSYTHALVVLNLAHMPDSACGTWPAFWTLGPDWPSHGEIDIIEGVNSQAADFMTLHSSPGCTIANGGDGTLQPYADNCDTAVNGNAGCSFHSNDTTSYGTGFNNNGGGIYAMEWTSDGVSIWFWGPGSSPAPADALGDDPQPANWGPPVANWQGTGCDWDAKFGNHSLIFDMTFCGDWAGSAFASDAKCSPLAATCTAYVQNNPSAFVNTYWSVENLKVYQQDPSEDDVKHLKGRKPSVSAKQVERCQDAGRCRRDKLTLKDRDFVVEERAAASQVTPSLISAASQTVDKRAAGSQVAPSNVPKTLRLPGHSKRTQKERSRKGGKDGASERRAVENMGQIRRDRFMKARAAGQI